MRTERIATKQGHDVPSQAHAPRGPFPPELFTNPPVLYDYTPQADNGSEEEPEGGTAQNNYRPKKYFRCRDCDLVLMEDELEDHECDDEEDDDE
jgi:hypothetical protein